MKQVPFATVCAGLVALGTVFGFFTLQLRADGYEQYVQYMAFASVMMYFTAAMTGVTWFRARRTDSD
ncbi:SCO3870 family protein [Streptomyces sp. NPDC001262]|uniref:SCO3870 family protein n=1 Tax=Streptomyces TaxID=1883 RepID=UPI0036C0B9CF